MAEDTIRERIVDAAKGVQSVSVDGMSTTAVDIDKMIRADEYDAGKSAKSRNHCGIAFRTLKPGGCG